MPSQKGAIAPPTTTLPPGALIDNVSQAAPTVQRQATGATAAPVEIESEIHRAQGSGQALDPQLQRSMGQAMGADFSHVKVHTDRTSDTLNHALQAKAFTTGSDVFFRQGEYNPSSKGGQELIAHELTHVVQQTGAAVQRQHDPIIQRLGLSDASKHLTSPDPAADQVARADFIRDNFSDFWFRLRMDRPLCDATLDFTDKNLAGENLRIIRDAYHASIGLPAIFDQYIPYDGPDYVNIGSRLRDRLIAQGRDNFTMTDMEEVLRELAGPVRTIIHNERSKPAFAADYIAMSDAFGYGAGGGRERTRGRGDASAD
ncbi:DUF4157 domain-containing protein [Spirulina major CS-329]|nr:DUF4157 domain-containing protein [Spirulina major]MDB9494042.1 DUF4157 domain-containing protein [Spirulina subsalsa CS-330]MDB9504441.1 DUF4157 domain-containing protein [Spirulina major CS-329]